ncbi:MAG: hypothetical protein AB1568_05830 [Thermodesulfobacteriota bacterium]
MAAMVLLTVAGERWAMPLVTGLFALIAASILGCTGLRYRTLRPSTLLIHAGVFLILAAGLGNGAGYTATANLYPGDSVGTFFRWDRQTQFSPGFAVRITEIDRRWYPAEIRLGILRHQAKQELITARTGTTVTAAGLTLTLGELDPLARQLDLEVRDGKGGHWRGKAGTLPLVAGDYGVQLVAFQTPALRSIGAGLQILENGVVRREGRVAVNDPLAWNGLRFSLTALDNDAAGNPYAGLQITSNPAWPVTVAGFLLTVCGLLLHLRHLVRPDRAAGAAKSFSTVNR